VLVVDDEFGIVDVLENGYGVLTTCNGKQALARLSAESPDLTLLHFMMRILGIL
jgi:CheY-like chemotaxis protein